MKSDREFLDGVYRKAETLRAENNPAPRVRRNRSMRYTMAAACACLLLVGGIFYQGSLPEMKIPQGYTNLAGEVPAQINALRMERGMAGFAESMYADAETVLVGKVTKIGKSVYEEENQSIITMVTVKPAEIYKGIPASDKIAVSVWGGVNERDKTYLDYEAVFTRGEEVLLFLNTREDGSYALSGGGEGKLSLTSRQSDNPVFANAEGCRISISELNQISEKEK